MKNVLDLARMVENAPFVSMRLSYADGMWKTLYVTENVSRYGFAREDFLSGKISWADMLHPDDKIMAQNLARDYIEKHLDEFRLQYRIMAGSGVSIFITEYSKITRDDDGSVLYVDSYLLNTTNYQASLDMAENYSRQQAILNEILMNLQENESGNAIQIILNRTGEYLNCSRALLFRDSPDHKTCKVAYEWLNKGISSIMDLDCAVNYDTEMPEIYVALRETGVLLVNAGHIPDKCREEFEREGLLSSAIFSVYDHGEPYGFVCFDDCVIRRTWTEDTANFLKNITNLVSSVVMRMNTEKRLRRHESETRRMAFTDHLTGLPNRYRCDAVLSDEINRAVANGRSGYLLFIDLDDFKIVNDCYGHDFGDGVLVTFAEYIRVLFHGGNRVFRFGGDEFVIIVAENEGDRLRHYLDTMLERAKKPWRALGKDFYCSLSIGIVEFPCHGIDATSIIKKADIAMYQAKKSGKNSYAFYTEGLDSDSLKRSEMEAMLRNSLLNNFQGFVVHYQPYSNTMTRQVVGAEALVRMKGPDGSLILPEQFLSLAEYLGLIVPLGEFVLSRAAAQCQAINASGFPDFSITVNLSAKQFRQKDILNRLDGILGRSGVNLNNLIIGINEGVALAELEKMLALCGELRRKGIKVALDDFGSGNSSFINMRKLPVDLIKVSSRYIDDIEDHFTGYFIKLVTELGHFTGKTICMNGVETERQYQFCRDFNIDMIQGFLFHRPNDVNHLMDLLHSRFTRVFFH